jgi:hypothetical protein
VVTPIASDDDWLPPPVTVYEHDPAAIGVTVMVVPEMTALAIPEHVVVAIPNDPP